MSNSMSIVAKSSVNTLKRSDVLKGRALSVPQPFFFKLLAHAIVTVKIPFYTVARALILLFLQKNS